jgi:riboflavin biosynthesis pyrimidine reductase
MHDAILVGIGTAINDDPQLNGIPAKSIFQII